MKIRVIEDTAGILKIREYYEQFYAYELGNRYMAVSWKNRIYKN